MRAVKKFLILFLKLAVTAVFVLLTASCLFTAYLNRVNVGVVTGVSVSLIVISLIWLYPLYKNIPPLRKAARVITALLIAGGIYCGVVSVFIISGMMNAPEAAVEASGGAEAPRTVIVLGCHADNGVPSQMLSERLNAAIRYMDTHSSAVCVVTGGQGYNESEPEAVSMHRYLITNGIEKDKIYIEDKSSNTEENIANAAGVIREHGLPTDVVIISDGYHLYRGARHARANGLSAAAIDATPRYMYSVIPSYWIREIAAISRDYVFDLLGIQKGA